MTTMLASLGVIWSSPLWSHSANFLRKIFDSILPMWSSQFAMRLLNLCLWTAQEWACHTTWGNSKVAMSEFEQLLLRWRSCFKVPHSDVASLPLNQRHILQDDCKQFLVTIQVSTIGYGDVTAQGVIEMAIAVVVFLIGIIFFGVLIGGITQLLQTASRDARKAQSYREKMNAVEDWLKRRQFSGTLRASLFILWFICDTEG